MSSLFGSGHAADLVLAVMLAEALWLMLVRHRQMGEVCAAILPGALIVLALRAALVHADWRWIVLPLAAALPAHLWDLRRRGWTGGRTDAANQKRY